MVGIAAATSYGLGCVVSGIGCHMHCLPLVYVGYGVLGGIGWGLGYISPVSTLMRWFPDRRGLATGLALTAFGAGAAVAAPIIRHLIALFEKAPQYLGALKDVPIIVQNGTQFAEVNGVLKEVVVATAADLSKLSSDLLEGIYVVGTGSTGAPEAFIALGVCYCATMAMGAWGARIPHPEWLPVQWQGDAGRLRRQSNSTTVDIHRYIDHKEALRTPQFYFLWSAVMCNAIAGTALISSAKILMTDIFGGIFPMLVTGVFASTYVAALSIANSGGRLGWAIASDYIGRRNTYFLFASSIPICGAIPYLTSWASTTGSVTPLALFFGGTLLSFSFYGGLFSVLPAYIADIFGQKHVGAIHGRLLTAWSCAALAGPMILTHLRKQSYNDAVNDLVTKCGAADFERTFGAPVAELPNVPPSHWFWKLKRFADCWRYVPLAQWTPHRSFTTQQCSLAL